MNLTIELTDITTERNSSRFMYDLFVDGKFVKFDEITRETTPSAEWLTNYFQKWAYRTYHIENAQVVLSYQN